MKLREFAKRYIFIPLGMTNTHFHDDLNEILKNRASGYMPIAEGGFRIHMTQLDMNDDAYDPGTCSIDFIRDESKRVVGFAMQADEIRNLEFKKIAE